MSWLDYFLNVINAIQGNGTPTLPSNTINFSGPGVTAVTDPFTKTTTVTIPSGEGNTVSAKTAVATNVTKTGTGTFGGVACGVGDVVLLAGQTVVLPAGSDNGLWIVAAGAWTRAAVPLESGLVVFIQEGDSAGRMPVLVTPDPIVVDTTPLEFRETYVNVLGSQTIAGVKTFEDPTQFQDEIQFVDFASAVIRQLEWTGTGTSDGGNLVAQAQSGQNVAAGTNNDGGDLVLNAGAAGTGGTGGAPGDVRLGNTGGTYVTIGEAGDAARVLVTDYDNLLLEAPTNVILRAGGISTSLSNLSLDLGPDVDFVFDSTSATPSVSQATRSGTGANAGVDLAVTAQAGQQQTGGAANNNGGNLVLRGGAAGTGGSGAAGTPGSVVIYNGATPWGYLYRDAATSVLENEDDDDIKILGADASIILDADNLIVDTTNFGLSTTAAAFGSGVVVTAPGTWQSDYLTANHAGVLNSIVMVDSGLEFTIGANEVWQFITWQGYINNGGAGSHRETVVVPAGATGTLMWHGTTTAITNYGTALGTAGEANAAVAMSGVVINGGTAGTVKVQYAQFAADPVNATVMQIGSYIMAWRIA